MVQTEDEIRGWFIGNLPDDWFTSEPDMRGDRDEILIIGTLPTPHVDEGSSDETKRAAALARIDRFREETRGHRMRIAQEAERRFDRKVSWGARCGDEQRLFTTLGVPVMTRLRLQEREVLDTLIDSGVARSRSEALAWCVRLVNRHQSEWLQDLRQALSHVEEVRAKGPDAEP
ncbi:MAG TPA: hypothetical protein VNZ58_11520 [Thermomicrobiales bacterium]|nr:hypothetical protein [Thermomicrobiales bacterium]